MSLKNDFRKAKTLLASTTIFLKIFLVTAQSGNIAHIRFLMVVRDGPGSFWP